MPPALGGTTSCTPDGTLRPGASRTLLLRQPVLDSATVAAQLGIDSADALRPLAPLVDAGVVTEFTGSARSRMWQAGEVLSALDAFAARAGRRAGGPRARR